METPGQLHIQQMQVIQQVRVSFSIAFSDTAGNAGTAVTSGTGSVTFDATAPTMAITAAEVSDGGTSNDGNSLSDVHFK